MMISNSVDQSNSRAVQGLVLLGALVLLPLGIASAQDYDAVEKRLGMAVGNGELTLEQASAMMAALRKSDDQKYHEVGADKEAWIGQRLREVGGQLKAAVEAGEITEEQAWARWHGFKEGQIFPRLRAAVESGKMTREEARGVRREIEKAEIAERLKAAVAKREISEEEARAKWAEVERERDHFAGIEGHFKRMGVDVETLDRVRTALNESGLQDEEVEQTLGGMIRVIHELRSEGERFELDPRLRDYFEEEIGLTEDQIELVQGLSRRIFHSARDSSREHSSNRITREDHARATPSFRKQSLRGRFRKRTHKHVSQSCAKQWRSIATAAMDVRIGTPSSVGLRAPSSAAI